MKKKTNWMNLIPKLAGDENAQQMAHDEQEDGAKFLEAYETAVKRAAEYLNREFPAVPVATWRAALDNPDAVHFTDEQRELRFKAAQKWIGTQC